jgi:hypothetical protein
MYWRGTSGIIFSVPRTRFPIPGRDRRRWLAAAEGSASGTWVACLLQSSSPAAACLRQIFDRLCSMGGGPSVAKYGVSHTSGQKSIILALFDIVVILFYTVEILFCTVHHTSPLLRPPSSATALLDAPRGFLTRSRALFSLFSSPTSISSAAKASTAFEHKVPSLLASHPPYDFLGVVFSNDWGGGALAGLPHSRPGEVWRPP